MKKKFVDLYMKFATNVAQLSYAKRLQVGAVIVKNDRIISFGYNGTPAGWDNSCEIVVEVNDDFGTREKVLQTKPEVIHAEANAIAKLAKNGESSDGADMFLTHSPCIECAKQIYTAGIKNVFYRSHYRNTDGLDFLKKCNVICNHIDSI